MAGGFFNFVSGWRSILLDHPLDAKMRETADVGVQTYLEHVHRITGYLASSAGTEYRQSDKTVLLHIDAPYGMAEALRGGAHDAITPACRAMGKVWDGNFEIHLPHAELGPKGEAGLKAQTAKLHKQIRGGWFSRGRGVAARTTIHARKHYHHPDAHADAMTPIL